VIARFVGVPVSRIDIDLGRSGTLRYADFSPLLEGLEALGESGELHLRLDPESFRGATLNLRGLPRGWKLRTNQVPGLTLDVPGWCDLGKGRAGPVKADPAPPRLHDAKHHESHRRKRETEERIIDKKARLVEPDGDSSGDDEGLAPPSYVKVFSKETREVLYPRALLAEMDAGLVIAKRAEPIPGIYSGGFSACRAVILQSRSQIALAHMAKRVEDGREEFEGSIDACLKLFRKRAQGEKVRLSIGYSTPGLRDAYAGDARTLGWHAFCEDHDGDLRRAVDASLPAGSESQKIKRAIKILLDRSERTMATWAGGAWARKNGVKLLQLPHGALLVPVNGNAIDLFRSEPSDLAVPAPHGPDGSGRLR
jgi:hypothetical protein